MWMKKKNVPHKGFGQVTVQFRMHAGTGQPAASCRKRRLKVKGLWVFSIWGRDSKVDYNLNDSRCFYKLQTSSTWCKCFSFKTESLLRQLWCMDLSFTCCVRSSHYQTHSGSNHVSQFHSHVALWQQFLFPTVFCCWNALNSAAGSNF